MNGGWLEASKESAAERGFGGLEVRQIPSFHSAPVSAIPLGSTSLSEPIAARIAYFLAHERSSWIVTGERALL